jgi:pimeloyl-ACP methyl ester carboxylesterase
MTSLGFEGVETAKVMGTTLAYHEQGEGEPVVFVHGGISDLRTWEQQLPAIGQDYRAITYSRRYSRPNAAIARGAADPYEQHVADLAAFLRAIDAAPAHLVGSSQGAFISLLTARDHPEVVRTLVLEEPDVMPLLGLSAPPRLAELLRLFATRPRTVIAILGFALRTGRPVMKALQRDDGDEEAARILLRGMLGQKSFEQVSEVTLERARENADLLRPVLLGSGPPPLSQDDVRGVHVPTLLVTGERSPTWLLHLTDVLEELLPDVERVEISRASHVMHEENAPAVNEAILGFLGRHRDRPTSPPSP